MIDDLKKHTRGVNILTPYLSELLSLISKVCAHNEGLVSLPFHIKFLD
jgi:hypothetical protein